MNQPPANLSRLLHWFRSEWNAEMPVTIHTRDTDAGGDPDWNARFKALVGFPGTSRTTTGEDIELQRILEEAKRLGSFPVRYQLRQMAKGGRRGYRRARFLFVLACQDFTVGDAARTISPAGHDEHGEDWASAYAKVTLLQLWHRLHDPAATYEDGRPRTFVERRISKSEAQARAEEARAETSA